tara:strand:- start:478 stop:1632 length:1155 start_codon:yes stop_codon:yes gene_type:complete
MSRNSKAKRDKKKKIKARAKNIAREEQGNKVNQISSSKKAFEKVWPEIQNKITEEKIRQAHHKTQYGNVKEQITADFQGYKFVAVGNQLHYGKSWKTFPDFLVGYLSNKLTAEWGNAEIAKSHDEKHQIVKLYQQLCHWQQKQSKGEGGIYRSTHTGVSAAYMQLAYDLYALDHHSKLQAEVIKRLKNRDGYQGARYELTVAATFIRAGFDIEHEDETDKSNKHPEFIATHKSTGQKIAVEAKSRHREGILGRSGTPKSEIKAGINRILNSALKKEPDFPYIICIDLNVPPIEGNVFESDIFKEVARNIDAKEKKQNGTNGFPATMYIFTNYPHHYVDSYHPDPQKTWVSTLVKNSRYPFESANVVHEINQALNQYGNIPNEFE